MSSNIAAASFGSFPYQIEKQSSDLEVSYKIGLINPSSNPVEVKLSSNESEEYNLTFPENKVKIPPGTTDDPSGSGWYHLGGGKYAKIHEVSFNVDISQYRQDNSLSFPIRIEAANIEGGTDGQSSTSKVVQVRNYRYRAKIDPRLRPRDRPENSDSESWKEKFWQEENSDSEEDFNLNQSKSSNQEQQTGEQEKRATETNFTEETRKSDNSLVDTTTLTLMAGIILSVAYILIEV